MRAPFPKKNKKKKILAHCKKSWLLQSQGDHAVFYRHSGKKEDAILIVYVDDIILTSDNNAELESPNK